MPKRTKSYHAWLLTQLSDPQIAAAYVTDAIADSPEMLPKVLRNVAEANKMKKVAEVAGVNRESLYRALSDQGNPGWETLWNVVKALHLKFQLVPDESVLSAAPSPSQDNEEPNSGHESSITNMAISPGITRNQLGISGPAVGQSLDSVERRVLAPPVSVPAAKPWLQSISA